MENVSLYVPKLSYSLLSVSKATESGRTTKFDETSCQILGKNHKVITAATCVSSLYYLDCQVKQQVGTQSPETSSRQTG